MTPSNPNKHTAAPRAEEFAILVDAVEDYAVFLLDRELAEMLKPEVIDSLLEMVPDAWLGDEPRFKTVAEHRAAYRDYLQHRLESPRRWMEDAADAQALSV